MSSALRVTSCRKSPMSWLRMKRVTFAFSMYSEVGSHAKSLTRATYRTRRRRPEGRLLALPESPVLLDEDLSVHECAVNLAHVREALLGGRLREPQVVVTLAERRARSPDARRLVVVAGRVAAVTRGRREVVRNGQLECRRVGAERWVGRRGRSIRRGSFADGAADL